MSIQFGLGTLSASGMTFGYLQGITLDFEWDEAQLHSGNGLYPVDVRIHSGSITGNAAFADIDAEALYKILGGTVSGSQVVLTNTSRPDYFQLSFTNTTDSLSMIIYLYRCKAGKLSLAFDRTAHVIPNFDFSAYADSSGRIGYIECGDVS